MWHGNCGESYIPSNIIQPNSCNWETGDLPGTFRITNVNLAGNRSLMGSKRKPGLGQCLVWEIQFAWSVPTFVAWPFYHSLFAECWMRIAYALPKIISNRDLCISGQKCIYKMLGTLRGSVLTLRGQSLSRPNSLQKSNIVPSKIPCL